MSEALEELGVGPAHPVSRRRHWSEAERLRVVAESYQPGVSVSMVARHHDMDANLLFPWRQRYGKRATGAGDGGAGAGGCRAGRTAGGADGKRHGLWAVGGSTMPLSSR